MLARRDLLKAGTAMLLMPALARCGQSTGPEAVAWERDACEHCRMIISERQFATELRSAKGRLYKFDDVGCAVHWAKRQGWSEADVAEFWVMSYDDGATWLDARKAFFLVNVRSPMNYNFAAVPDTREGTVAYADMIDRLAAGTSHTNCDVPGTSVAEAR